MTHPNGLTNADVAHLKDGMEAHVTFMSNPSGEVNATGTLYISNGELCLGPWIVRRISGEPGISVVRVVSPVPPTPPMVEPTWLGAPFMCEWGFAFRGRSCWITERGGFRWSELPNPRPLTADERRNLGIPETVPEGWVCVDVSDVADEWLAQCIDLGDRTPTWWPGPIVARLARAELARREATT